MDFNLERSSKASKVGLGIEAKSSWAVSQVASWMVEDKTTFGHLGACVVCCSFSEAFCFTDRECRALRALAHFIIFIGHHENGTKVKRREENNGTVFFPVLSLTHFCHCSHSNAVDYLTTHCCRWFWWLALYCWESRGWEQKVDLDLM